MKIAVYSDIHDNLHNLRLVLTEMKNRNIEKAIFLGDFINPGLVKEIIDAGIPTKAIWGNNDGDKMQITKLSYESNGVLGMASETFAAYQFDDKKVFLTHYPNYAGSIAKSGDYEAVFYGHNHEIHVEKLPNGCLLANPGEISTHKTGRCTFIVWNPESNEVETVEIENIINVNL